MSDFSNTHPELAISGLKIDPISDVRNSGLVTNGSVFWVESPSDSVYTTFKYQVGAANLKDTIQDGVTVARNDKNDYVFVVPKDSIATWAPHDTAGTALVLNKSRLHLISSGYTRSLAGYQNTIRGFATTSAVDSALIKVNAPAVEFAGFRVLGTMGTSDNGTVTNVITLGTASTGTAHNAWIHDCALEVNNASGGGADGTYTIVGMTNATGPDGLRMSNVTIGNLAGPCIAVQLNHIGAQHRFENCMFVTNAGATADKLVTAGTGNTRYVLFDRCTLMSVSTNALASAVTGSTTVNNPILMSYCTYVNVTQAGTDPTVFKAPVESGTSAAIRDLGIAVGTAALVPA